MTRHSDHSHQPLHDPADDALTTRLDALAEHDRAAPPADFEARLARVAANRPATRPSVIARWRFPAAALAAAAAIALIVSPLFTAPLASDAAIEIELAAALDSVWTTNDPLASTDLASIENDLDELAAAIDAPFLVTDSFTFDLPGDNS